MKAKTLDNASESQAVESVPDILVVGSTDMWLLLCKASSKKEGWMKSTKAMEIPGHGCVVQTTTQQKNPDGSYSLSDSLTTVHGVKIESDVNGGRKLVALEFGR